MGGGTREAAAGDPVGCLAHGKQQGRIRASARTRMHLEQQGTCAFVVVIGGACVALEIGGEYNGMNGIDMVAMR